MEKKKVEHEDIAIGGTFEYKGKTYICKKTEYHKGCLGCAFYIKEKNECDELPFGCIALSRKDHANVIAIEV